MASKEANRLKYQYNKKYVEAYWERKAQQQNGETATKKTRKTVLEKPRDFDPFGQTGFAHLWLQYD